MKAKILNFLLVVSSLIGYLEWGGNNAIFLGQAELDIIQKIFWDPLSVAHPFVLLPLVGQIILIITLFQKQPSKSWTYISMLMIGLLLGFMLIIGMISLNFKIAASVIPFLVISLLTITQKD
jgi:NAD/NADP transhydrogenase beta subunit